MPKVSVIVPIYGVEKYIERCARSLFEQTLDDIEYVFVDDCTKDNSIEVLKKVIEDYPHRKGQIRILHHERNKGLSHARETGVKAASGDYIAHCDSDDWVSTRMYETMYNKAISRNLDFMKCGHFISDGLKHSPYEVFGDDDLKVEDAIRYLLMWRGWNSIWDTLVKKNVYDDNIRYTDYPMLEDFFVSSQLLMNAKSIGIVNTPLYYYYVNPLSISNDPDPNAIVNRCKQAEDNISFILKLIHENYGNLFRKEELILLTIPRRILVPLMRKYGGYKYWDQLMAPSLYELMKSDLWSRSLKLQYLLISLRLYPLFKLIH